MKPYPFPPTSRLTSLAARDESGFTLIELMAVLAIIAIMGALTLPSYFSRAVRLQVEEALQLAEIAKKPVMAAYAEKLPLPTDNASAGIAAADLIVSNYVSSVALQSGAIHITFGNNAAGALKGKVLSLRPAIVPEAPTVPIAWVCGTAAVPGKMVAQGENKTNVAASNLPLTCRGSAQSAT